MPPIPRPDPEPLPIPRPRPRPPFPPWPPPIPPPNPVMTEGSYVMDSEGAGRMATGQFFGRGEPEFVKLDFTPRKIYVLAWGNCSEGEWDDSIPAGALIRTGPAGRVSHWDVDEYNGITPVFDYDLSEGGRGFICGMGYGLLCNGGALHYWVAWE